MLFKQVQSKYGYASSCKCTEELQKLLQEWSNARHRLVTAADTQGKSMLQTSADMCASSGQAEVTES